MHDDDIINSITNADIQTLDDLRAHLRIALLVARLDEYDTHIPNMTVAANSVAHRRSARLYETLQHARAALTERSPSPFTERG